MSSTQRLDLSHQCTAVNLSPHSEQIRDAAVELHLAANRNSGQVWKDDQSYRDRAEMGYTAELAVSQYYSLTPVIDYRPSGVGDVGHDYRVQFGDEILTIDVKSTRTKPPALHLNRNRKQSDAHTLPDAYLLCSGQFTQGDGDVHLVGWIRTDELIEQGEEMVINQHPVWRLDGRNLNRPFDRDEISELESAEQKELYAAADRMGNPSVEQTDIERAVEILSQT